MTVVLRRVPQGFIPATPQDEEWARRIKVGDQIHADFKKQRNSGFHRKFFALLNLGFESWEPPESDFRGIPAAKNFDRFREDCTIAAGYYDVVICLNGEHRLKAKSISFARMDDDEFHKLYSNVADVLLQRVLARYTKTDLERVIQEILAFT